MKIDASDYPNYGLDEGDEQDATPAMLTREREYWEQVERDEAFWRAREQREPAEWGDNAWIAKEAYQEAGIHLSRDALQADLRGVYLRALASCPGC